MAIDLQLARQFDEDGYIIVKDLFSKDEVDELGRRIEEICDGKIDFPEAGNGMGARYDDADTLHAVYPEAAQRCLL